MFRRELLKSDEKMKPYEKIVSKLESLVERSAEQVRIGIANIRASYDEKEEILSGDERLFRSEVSFAEIEELRVYNEHSGFICTMNQALQIVANCLGEDYQPLQRLVHKEDYEPIEDYIKARFKFWDFSEK